MNESLKKRLLELLKKHRLVSSEAMERALQIQRAQGGSLSEILVKQGVVSSKDLMGLLSAELNIPPINLGKCTLDPEVVKLVPERLARQYHVVPIAKLGHTLTVAMADPMNIFALDDLKMLTKFEIDPVLAADEDIMKTLGGIYGQEREGMTALVEEHASDAEEDAEGLPVAAVSEDESATNVDQITTESARAPIVKMVDLMLAEALKKRASDIHIEPYETQVRVRYRVDGNLQVAFIVPKKNQNAVLARLKIMSRLDITENRLPQDGRFKIHFENREIDFRVSALPVTHGNKVVLRALDKQNLSMGLDKLGMLPEPIAHFKEAVARPFGMILVTGPTGSGKSTTLYSVLNQLNSTERNIVTIEDPVEYQLEGTTQIQVLPEIGLTFANGLRSILRQTPDIIMVGEIRDGETADIAVKASLTGQLVLSTLHTNDAPGALTRLADMGVEPFLIASSLIMVAAQRLTRKICTNCREAYDVPKDVLERVGFTTAMLKQPPAFFRAKGCLKCNKTGYHGRMGTLETLTLDDKIRDMLVGGASSDEIKTYARGQGMETLRENALRQFALGMTTLEEVLRVTAEE
ncbi:MAG: Flp pilus assembly complex ATPase component TadA [Candidatus Omnitrophica bacterium]|nr:Flp pilus assembly complex ATPase component TadA [Candidatus Omnitrophota bacterium]